MLSILAHDVRIGFQLIPRLCSARCETSCLVVVLTPEALEVPSEAYVTASRSQGGRVLLVSSPGLDRELYASALGDGGFVTIAVGTALAAAEWLGRSEPPDVMVMDLVPEPDQAWALVERWLTEPCRAPVIIFTSLIRPDGANRRRARSLDCAAFVAKPCSLRQLVDVVSRVRRGERGLEVSVYSE